MITKKKFIFTFEEICKIIACDLSLIGGDADFETHLRLEKSNLTFIMHKPISMERLKGIIRTELEKVGENGEFKITFEGSNFVCEEEGFNPLAHISFSRRSVKQVLEEYERVLSVKAYNMMMILSSADADKRNYQDMTINDLIRLGPEFKPRNFGKKTWREVVSFLHEKQVDIKSCSFVEWF